MQLAGWLRTALWKADDWRATLALFGDSIDETTDGGRAHDLGRALEHIEPDRRRALAAHRAAWRAGHTAALAPARRLAREIRDHVARAELAQEELERGGRPELLVEVATAWIDAGQAKQAGGALAAAARKLAGDERLATLRAVAEGQKDARGEVARWFERAVTTNDPAAACLTLRLARLGRLGDDQQGRLLRTSLDRWPGDDDVAAMVEEHLLQRGDPDELLTFYKLRLGTRPEARAWADEVRAIASRLCVRGIAPGLGLRLLKRGLEHAYGAGVTDVPGHLASWSLLADHARSIRATREVLPLALTALRMQISETDRLWLGRLGLEVVWGDARDAEAAAAWAAVVIEVAPHHPDVREFVQQQAIDLDRDDGRGAAPTATGEITELAMSLVYLDEHGGRHHEDAAVVAKTTGLAAAAIVKDAPFQQPEAAKPAWMSANTQRMAAIGAGAVEATEKALVAPRITATFPAAEPPPAVPASPEKQTLGPVIPTAAVAALRRISTRLRTPTPPSLPEGARDRAARVVVPVDVVVELYDGTKVQAIVRDISTTGLFILLDRALDVGAELTCELGLPSRDDTLAITRHRAWARIVRKGGGGYGLELLDPEPELVEAISALTTGD